MATKRLVWADVLKGLLIVLVVLGHAIQETLGDVCFKNHLWNYIYSFHMPAFMTVSGYLSHKADGGGQINRWLNIHRRFRQLLVPFLLWSLVKWISYQHCDLSILPNIVLYPDGYFWFLWVLFFIVVFFNFGDWLSDKLKLRQDVILMGLCVLFSILMVMADIRILGFQFFAYYFIFYVLGYLLHKHGKLTAINNWLLLGLTGIWAIMAWFWKMHELPPFLSRVPVPQTIMQYGYRFITALVAVYVLLCAGPKMLNKERESIIPFVKLGQISLGIYVVHLLLMPVIVKGLDTVSNSVSVIITVSFVLALLSSWFVVWLLSKWSVTNKLLLGKI